MATPVAVCDPWPVDFTNCHAVPDTLTPEQQDRYVLAASQYLWMMTGRRIGPSCPVVVRPCRKKCADGFLDRFLYHGQRYRSTAGWVPYMFNGQMRNATLCGCVQDCHCGPEMCQVRLRGPVYDITAVDVGGTVLDPGTYHVYDGEWLTRINPSPLPDDTAANCFPSCQDLTAAPGSPDTFTVTYRTGLEVPALGVLAVSSLAAHMMADCGGCGDCGEGTRQNLSRLSRQGVELEFADAQQVFTDGRTGIEIVDQFIRAVNPYGLADAPRVLSPDAPRYGRNW